MSGPTGRGLISVIRLERDLDDRLEIDCSTVFHRRAEMPFLQRRAGAGIEAFVHSLQNSNLADVAIGPNHGI